MSLACGRAYSARDREPLFPDAREPAPNPGRDLGENRTADFARILERSGHANGGVPTGNGPRGRGSTGAPPRVRGVHREPDGKAGWTRSIGFALEAGQCEDPAFESERPWPT